ncbi:hypothetical protein WMY93_006476 [Mugilogobius chulae]|uniref:Uncharacterized protein n=1 Tax=Mugilogobius chulae TaxID=88201 RepID=A0AAW0PMK5_9GOBI
MKRGRKTQERKREREKRGRKREMKKEREEEREKERGREESEKEGERKRENREEERKREGERKNERKIRKRERGRETRERKRDEEREKREKERGREEKRGGEREREMKRERAKERRGEGERKNERKIRKRVKEGERQEREEEREKEKEEDKKEREEEGERQERGRKRERERETTCSHSGPLLDPCPTYSQTMMFAVLGLLVTALSVESYVVHDTHDRLPHGRQLKIYLPKSTEKLEFIPFDDPRQTLTYWDKRRSSSWTMKGHVSGSGNDRRWYLDGVTYDDQGTYIQKDYWDKEMSTLKVAVTAKNNYIKRVAGRSLYVSLEGIRQEDATLKFSGESANVTLVRDGALVSQELPDYFDRVRFSSRNIEIVSVNVSDVGHYHLFDRKGRLVSMTRLDLTDKEESEGNPLLALLLLLGIPAGVCCCCRKKIFKSKSTTAQTVQSTPGVIISPGPTGPSPPYNQPTPGGYYPTPATDLGPAIHPPPSPSMNPGYPAPNPAYPAANPAYPAANPAYPAASPGYPAANPGYPPPAGAPQWNGPPPAAGLYPSYPPGPTAPMGYTPAPVMYSEAPPKEEIKMENMAPAPAPAPTDPLLTHPPETSPSSATAPPAPTSADGAVTFDIGKTNFL